MTKIKIKWLREYQQRRFTKRGIRLGRLVPVTFKELIKTGYVGIILGAPIYSEYKPEPWIKRFGRKLKWYLWNELFLAGWDN